MHVGARAGQHNAVDDFEQRGDIGDLGDRRKHHGDGAGHFRDRAQIALADRLNGETIFDAMRIADDTDDGPSHSMNVSRKNFFSRWATIPGRSCLPRSGGSIRVACTRRAIPLQ